MSLKEGQGNTVPNYTFDLAGFGLGKISALENISVTAFLTDVTGQTFETDPVVIPITYTRLVKAKAQRNEQRVMEKYALILFDYDSAEIKERNKVVLYVITSYSIHYTKLYDPGLFDLPAGPQYQTARF